MARRKSKRIRNDEVKLEMTPMIDVVFQLLIFFIVTFKQEDILASIQAMRPDPTPGESTSPSEPTTIVIDVNGFYIRDKQVRESELRKTIERTASYGTSKNIIIKCTASSSHTNLMKVLDICAQYNMKNIAIFSL